MSTDKPTGKDSENITQLLNEGIDAAKVGDKSKAREKLRRVVELDERNEKAWFWLAGVVETDEERRVALGNTVLINPNNAQAQKMLEDVAKPSVPVRKYTSSLQVMVGGVDPRTLKILAGAGGALLVLLLLVAVLGRRNSAQNNVLVPASPLPVNPTQDAALALAQTSTQLAVLQAPTLPPSWTPKASVTPKGTPISTVLASPPPTLPGRLVAMYGIPLTLDGNLPLVLIDLKTNKISDPITDQDRGDYGVMTPDGQQVIYGRFISSVNDQQLRILNLNNAPHTELSALWGNKPPVAKQKMVSVAANGKAIVFAAQNILQNDPNLELFYLPVNFIGKVTAVAPTGAATTQATVVAPTNTTAPTGLATVAATTAANATAAHTPTNAPYPLIQLTQKGSGVNTWPSVSPDGALIIFVSDKQTTDQGPDIYLMSVQDSAPHNLTNDSAANIEAAPEWSPDGKQIAFQSHPQGKTDSDIYIMDATGQNKKVLVQGGSDNIRPHWSPDGKYIAFTSNRTKNQEIFIVEVATGKLYQLTNSATITAICTGWGQ